MAPPAALTPARAGASARPSCEGEGESTLEGFFFGGGHPFTCILGPPKATKRPHKATKRPPQSRPPTAPGRFWLRGGFGSQKSPPTQTKSLWHRQVGALGAPKPQAKQPRGDGDGQTDGQASPNPSALGISPPQRPSVPSRLPRPARSSLIPANYPTSRHLASRGTLNQYLRALIKRRQGRLTRRQGARRGQSLSEAQPRAGARVYQKSLVGTEKRSCWCRPPLPKPTDLPPKIKRRRETPVPGGRKHRFGYPALLQRLVSFSASCELSPRPSAS